MKKVVAAGPDDLDLVSILARLCFAHRLELDSAAAVVRQALSEDPEHRALESTLEQLSAASRTLVGASDLPNLDDPD